MPEVADELSATSGVISDDSQSTQQIFSANMQIHMQTRSASFAIDESLVSDSERYSALSKFSELINDMIVINCSCYIGAAV